jgi:hypothetical protein
MNQICMHLSVRPAQMMTGPAVPVTDFVEDHGVLDITFMKLIACSVRLSVIIHG